MDIVMERFEKEDTFGLTALQMSRTIPRTRLSIKTCSVT